MGGAAGPAWSLRRLGCPRPRGRAAVPRRGTPRKFRRSCWAGEGLWACQEGQMAQKLVRFGALSRGTRSRQDASIEVHEAVRIRPSSGSNGGHVRWWIGLICALLWGSLGSISIAKPRQTDGADLLALCSRDSASSSLVEQHTAQTFCCCLRSKTCVGWLLSGKRCIKRERAARSLRAAHSLGQEPTGRRSISTSHLVHRLPRKQRTRELTRSYLAVLYLIQIQTRLPDSTAKGECSAGSAEGPRSKRQRNFRPANDTSFRKFTTEKTTAWNCASRQQVLRGSPEGTRSSLIGASQCFVATRSKFSPTLDLRTHAPPSK
jgi:hypothetical protein